MIGRHTLVVRTLDGRIRVYRGDNLITERGEEELAKRVAEAPGNVTWDNANVRMVISDANDTETTLSQADDSPAENTNNGAVWSFVGNISGNFDLTPAVDVGFTGQLQVSAGTWVDVFTLALSDLDPAETAASWGVGTTLTFHWTLGIQFLNFPTYENEDGDDTYLNLSEDSTGTRDMTFDWDSQLSSSSRRIAAHIAGLGGVDFSQGQVRFYIPVAEGGIPPGEVASDLGTWRRVATTLNLDGAYELAAVSGSSDVVRQMVYGPFEVPALDGAASISGSNQIGAEAAYALMIGSDASFVIFLAAGIFSATSAAVPDQNIRVVVEDNPDGG